MPPNEPTPEDPQPAIEDPTTEPPKEEEKPEEAPPTEDLAALQARFDDTVAQLSATIGERDEARAAAASLQQAAETQSHELMTQITELQARELAAVRDRILAQNQDVVGELVAGTTPAELEASVERARTAYQEILSKARAEVADNVPPGASGNTPAPTENMSSLERLTHAFNHKNGR